MYLSIRPVVFAPTRTFSLLMVYLPMAKLFIQSDLGDILLDMILDAPVLINHISQSDCGVFTVLMFCLWRSRVCGDNIRQSLCLWWGSDVITADLDIIEGLFQNQRLLIIMSLINL